MSLVIQDGGLIATRLQKLLGIQGSVRPELETFILPTITVADLSTGGVPPVGRSAGATWTEAAVAGENSVWRLEVPGGIICRVDKIGARMLTTNTPLIVFFGSSVPTPGTIRGGIYTDGRLAGFGIEPAQVPAVIVASGTQVGSLGAFSFQQRMDIGLGTIIEPKNWYAGGGNPDFFGFIEFMANRSNEGVVWTVEWTEWQYF